jgi:hypothetical protein
LCMASLWFPFKTLDYIKITRSNVSIVPVRPGKHSEFSYTHGTPYHEILNFFRNQSYNFN